VNVAGSALQVELDVFSGHPNPSWPLEPEQARVLIAKLRRLRLRSEPGPSGLGYRGFVVHRIDRGRVVPWLRVAAGSIRVERGGRSVLYRDDEGLEEWLREQAMVRGLGALLSAAGE
jgi:hypothetical protein